MKYNAMLPWHMIDNNQMEISSIQGPYFTPSKIIDTYYSVRNYLLD